MRKRGGRHRVEEERKEEGREEEVEGGGRGHFNSPSIFRGSEASAQLLILDDLTGALGEFEAEGLSARNCSKETVLDLDLPFFFLPPVERGGKGCKRKKARS